MIVADTNVISYLMLPTSYTDSVEALYKIDSYWSAPTLWRSEFRNVLAFYLRKNIISLEKARQLQSRAESLMIDHEYEMSSSHILTLVDESGCSAYDCEFVALAQHLGLQLVTQDKKILAEFPSLAISVSGFLSAKG